MWQSLTKSRTPDYHRQTMMKIVLIAGLLYVFWQPLAPVRQVVSDTLSFTSEQVRK